MSETLSMTLTDFLLARIAEDEAVANAASTWQVRDKDGWKEIPAEPAEWFAGDHGYGVGAVERRNSAPNDVGIVVYDEGCPSDAESEHIARHDPARVLAECAAKRRIMDMFSGNLHEKWDDGHEVAKVADALLRTLASVYVDRPDYQQEWA